MLMIRGPCPALSAHPGGQERDWKLSACPGETPSCSGGREGSCETDLVQGSARARNQPATACPASWYATVVFSPGCRTWVFFSRPSKGVGRAGGGVSSARRAGALQRLSSGDREAPRAMTQVGSLGEGVQSRSLAALQPLGVLRSAWLPNPWRCSRDDSSWWGLDSPGSPAPGRCWGSSADAPGGTRSAQHAREGEGRGAAAEPHSGGLTHLPSKGRRAAGHPQGQERCTHICPCSSTLAPWWGAWEERQGPRSALSSLHGEGSHGLRKVPAAPATGLCLAMQQTTAASILALPPESGARLGPDDSLE